MSLELYVAIPAICDPSAKELNAAAAAFELPIILESSFNLKSVDGFQPATFNGEQTGAEMSIEDKAEVFDMYPDFAEAAPQLDRVVTLRWGAMSLKWPSPTLSRQRSQRLAAASFTNRKGEL